MVRIMSDRRREESGRGQGGVNSKTSALHGWTALSGLSRGSPRPSRDGIAGGHCLAVGRESGLRDEQMVPEPLQSLRAAVWSRISA